MWITFLYIRRENSSIIRLVYELIKSNDFRRILISQNELSDYCFYYYAIKGFILRMYCGQFKRSARITVNWLAMPAK